MRRLASGRRHGLLHTLLRPRLVLVRPVYVLVAALALVLGLAVLLRHGSGPRPRPAPSLLAAPTAPPAALPACAPATVLVRFVLPAPGARTVALAGDFNGWRVGDIMLANAREDGVFTVTVPLQAGASYRYMFVVDGSRWVPDPSAEAYRPDGFGRQNSLLRL